MTMSDQPHTDRELLLLIHENVKGLVECKEDHETRIRTLESWQWKATGLATGISGFFGTVMGLLIGKGGS